MHSSSVIPSTLSLIETELRRETTIGSIANGKTARVSRLDLDADFGDWLRAVGIDVGERITVLRRAIFGGPIHVRTACGGEFALNRALANAIKVSGIEDEPLR